MDSGTRLVLWTRAPWGDQLVYFSQLGARTKHIFLNIIAGEIGENSEVFEKINAKKSLMDMLKKPFEKRMQAVL